MEVEMFLPAPRLYTSDLHLTTHPDDEYRWEIFPWLLKTIDRKKAKSVLILGDLTNIKDGHSAKLVNRLITHINSLAKVVPVVILKGNHDYTDPAVPFFRFLSKIPNVSFIWKIKEVSDGNLLLFLPHTRSYKGDWKGIKWEKYDRIYIHQTVTGSSSSFGQILQGTPKVVFEHCRADCKVIAGDVHVPQSVGRVTYCGAPYPVSFGDSYAPRVLFDDGKEVVSVPRFTVKKEVIRVNSYEEFIGTQYDLSEGDMIKVVFELERSEYPLFKEYRQQVTDWALASKLTLRGVELKGREVAQTQSESTEVEVLDPSGVVRRYGRSRGLDAMHIEAGINLCL